MGLTSHVTKLMWNVCMEYIVSVFVTVPKLNKNEIPNSYQDFPYFVITNNIKTYFNYSTIRIRRITKAEHSSPPLLEIVQIPAF